MTIKLNLFSKSLPLAGASAALLTLVLACQGQPESNKRTNGKAGGDAEAATPSPSVSASPSASASPSPSPSPASTVSCEDQWKQYVAKFKVGAKLTYNGSAKYSVLLTPKTAPITRAEEVTASSDAAVERTVTVSSTDPEVSNILNLLQLTPKVKVAKEQFISVCGKAQNVGANSVAFMGATVQVLENKEQAVTVLGQSQTAHYLKLKTDAANITAFAINADVEVWISKDVPGLVLKQNTVLNNIPFTGAVTIIDELTAQSGF